MTRIFPQLAQILANLNGPDLQGVLPLPLMQHKISVDRTHLLIHRQFSDSTPTILLLSKLQLAEILGNLDGADLQGVLNLINNGDMPTDGEIELDFDALPHVSFVVNSNDKTLACVCEHVSDET